MHKEPTHKEKDLNELVDRLQAAAGSNLKNVVLYGSAASHEFQQAHSDLNVLCLLERMDANELAKLQPVCTWWWRKGHSSPLVFTIDELRQSADVFAIELLDMKQHHRLLLGEDFLSQLDVPMSLHRLQVERELRSGVVRLRQAYLRSGGRRSDILDLMIASVPSFATLFRHVLITLGEHAHHSRRLAVDQLAARLKFDAAAFHTVLDLREGNRGTADVNHEHVFSSYLNVVTLVAGEVDKMLAANQ